MSGDEGGCIDDPNLDQPCENPQPTYPAQSGGIQLAAEYTFQGCMAPSSPWGDPDRDRDGIDDDCEFELAEQFQPRLALHWDDGDVTREPYFSVARGLYTNQIRIFYLLAYHRDLGSYFGITHHDGDNEFIIITVADAGGGLWRLQSAILSAHYDKWPFDGTRSWGYWQIEYPYTHQGRPLVYVAKNKHANFTSVERCGEGAWGFDTCDNNGRLQDLKTLSVDGLGRFYDRFWANNIGNGNNEWGSRLINCIGSFQTYQTSYDGQECFWTDDKFRGWTISSEPDSGPYRDPLWEFKVLIGFGCPGLGRLAAPVHFIATNPGQT